MKSDISLLVGTCDSYFFLMEDFIKCYNLTWDDDIFQDKVVGSETYSLEIDGWKFITPGKQDWASRIKYSLEFIKTKYVFLVLDDYWFVKSLSSPQINNYLNFLDNNDGLKLAIHHQGTGVKFNNTNYIEGIKSHQPNSGCLMSLQCTIWNVDFLRDNLYQGESPWGFEVNGQRRIGGDPSISSRIYWLETGPDPLYNLNMNVVRKGGRKQPIYYQMKDMLDRGEDITKLSR